MRATSVAVDMLHALCRADLMQQAQVAAVHSMRSVRSARNSRDDAQDGRDAQSLYLRPAAGGPSRGEPYDVHSLDGSDERSGEHLGAARPPSDGGRMGGGGQPGGAHMDELMEAMLLPLRPAPPTHPLRATPPTLSVHAAGSRPASLDGARSVARGSRSASFDGSSVPLLDEVAEEAAARVSVPAPRVQRSILDDSLIQDHFA